MADTAALEGFRKEVRTWLEANFPSSLKDKAPMMEGRQTLADDMIRWRDALAGKGWGAPTWPKEYGGAGLDHPHARVVAQEMGRMGAINPIPLLAGMGVTMVGPTVLEYGTEEQKAKHLPGIASGTVRWCLGLSEPNAGSDLAALTTRAVDAGDHYVINGQKIWTSGADKADWMFCLVRTDPKAPKHQGITFILFDMTTPGVSVRPIRLISGLSPFCETFLEDVRVPQRNVVGEVNKGWTVAKRLLQYERTSIGGIGGGQRTTTLEELAADYVGKAGGRIADPDLRGAILRHRMNDRAFALTLKRAQEESAAGTAPGAVSSMFKYYGTEQNKGRFELMLSITGTCGLGWAEPGFSPAELDITRGWLRSKGNSIEGGTSEVQLNIIAKRVLELPD